MNGLFSPLHLVILLLVALLLFGAKRLPEIGRSLGLGIREFKDSVTKADSEEQSEPVRAIPPGTFAPPAATAPPPTPEPAVIPEPTPAPEPAAAPEPTVPPGTDPTP